MERENSSVLLLSIETVSAVAHYKDLSPFEQALWEEKHNYLPLEEIDIEALYQKRAAVEAEFGRIISIGLGFLRIRDGKGESLRLHLLEESSEEALLKAFLEALPTSSHYMLCAHNGREFDVPFLCRRLLSHQLPLPAPLQIQGKKPWQFKHIHDTFDRWHFGDKKHYTSLRLLCHTLHIEVEDILQRISGKDIHQLYYENQDMHTISQYVAAQLRATAQVYLRLQGKALLVELDICLESKKEE